MTRRTVRLFVGVCAILSSALWPDGASAYSLFDPVPDDQLRALATDRPTKASGPVTVDAGHFQYEGDLTAWSYDRYNDTATTISAFTIGDVVLKAGLTGDLDAELALAPVNTVAVKARATDTRNAAFGFGDTQMRVKWNLFGNDGGDAALALVPYVKAPTAAAQIGNRHWEGGIYAPFTYALSDGWVLGMQSEYDRLERADLTGTYSNFINLANLGHSLWRDDLTGYVEFWSDTGNDQGGFVQYTGDLALAWLATPDLQVDGGVNVGLNRAAPDLQLYAGISQRF